MENVSPEETQTPKQGKRASAHSRRIERQDALNAEIAKANAEKMALISCIETLVAGIKGELHTKK